MSECIVEQTVHIPVPQIHDPIVEGANVIPQELLQQRTAEHIADVPGVPGGREVPRQGRGEQDEDRGEESFGESLRRGANHLW